MKIEELAQKIQAWDIKKGAVPQEWLDEYGKLWAEEQNEKNYQKELKSKEMRNRRRRGKYGEKKIMKQMGGRADGRVGKKDGVKGMFSFEIKWVKKTPKYLDKIMDEAQRHCPKDKIAVGVVHNTENRREFYIVEKDAWLELHGKER